MDEDDDIVYWSDGSSESLKRARSKCLKAETSEIAVQKSDIDISAKLVPTTPIIANEPLREKYPLRVYIKVAYAEKERAKSAGAKWDPENKLWYSYKRAGSHSSLLSAFQCVFKEDEIAIDSKKLHPDCNYVDIQLIRGRCILTAVPNSPMTPIKEQRMRKLLEEMNSIAEE